MRLTDTDIIPRQHNNKNYVGSFLALWMQIWHNKRVEPFRRAVSFQRVPSGRVTCLANGAKDWRCKCRNR